nr:hypothetical protein [Salmonid herpesvirus 1]
MTPGFQSEIISGLWGRWISPRYGGNRDPIVITNTVDTTPTFRDVGPGESGKYFLGLISHVPPLRIRSKYRGHCGVYYNCSTPMGADVRLKVSSHTDCHKECDILRTLDHPHLEEILLTIIGSDPVKGGDQSAAQYIGASTVLFLTPLSHRLGDHQFKLYREGVRLMVQLTRAVKYMEKMGYAHMRICPNVIYVNYLGDLILTDFSYVQPIGTEAVVIEGSVSNEMTYVYPPLRKLTRKKAIVVTSMIDRYSTGRVGEFVSSTIQADIGAKTQWAESTYKSWLHSLTMMACRDGEWELGLVFPREPDWE